MLHPKVKKYIFESDEKEILLHHIKQLSDDPYNKRAEADIKKLKGKKTHIVSVTNWHSPIRIFY